MKIVYDGKIYDTETAKLLYEENVYINGNCAGTDSLMITPRGRFLIHKTSNGQDLYRHASLKPVTHKEAIEWLHGRLITDEEHQLLLKYIDLDKG